MSAIYDQERAEWERATAVLSQEKQIAEAILGVAMGLREAGTKAPTAAAATWISWSGKGCLLAIYSYIEGAVQFSWEYRIGVEALRFSDVAEAVLEVSKIVGKRKTRFKRAKKEGEQ